MSNTIQLQKHAKGSRPFFFDDPAVDKLLAMLLAMAGEVSVMRDRQDTIERLLSDKGILSTDDVNAYDPPKNVLLERDEQREEFLRHVLRIVDIEQDQDDMHANDVSPEWQQIIDSVNQPP